MPPVEAQQVYKVINPDGSVTYTDQPTNNATEVKLNAGSTVIMTNAKPSPVVQQKTKKTIANDYQLNIIQPLADATIRNNAGDMMIVATLNKDIPGQYRLWLDDKVIKTQLSPTFTLSSIDRGAHTFYIEFISNKGKTLALSSKQTFYLHQASVFNRSN
jgi:hypothetical protein